MALAKLLSALTLILFSFSAPGGVLILGQKSLEINAKKEAVATIDIKEVSNDSYIMRFEKGTVNLTDAVIFLNSKGQLELKTLVIDVPYQRVEGKFSKRVSSNIPFSDKKIETRINSGSAEISGPSLTLTLMSPVVLRDTDPLSVPKDNSAMKTLLSRILLPEGQPARLDQVFSFKSNGDFSGAKGGMHDLSIEARVTLSEDILPPVIDELSKSSHLEALIAGTHNFIPEAANKKDSSFALNLNQREGSTFYTVTKSDQKNAEIDPEALKNVGARGTLLLDGETASTWVQSYLNSRKDNLPKGYTKGENDQQFIYTPTAVEKPLILSSILGSDSADSFSWNTASTSVSFLRNTGVTGKSAEIVEVSLELSENGKRRIVRARYRLSAKDGFEFVEVADEAGAALTVDLTPSKFFGRDLRNILIHSLMAKPIRESLGAEVAAPQMKLQKGEEAQADSFGEVGEKALLLSITF